MTGRNPKNREGFTLAELLIVVAIISVLVGISIPVFHDQRRKARLAANQANARAAVAAAIVKYYDIGASNPLIGKGSLYNNDPIYNTWYMSMVYDNSTGTITEYGGLGGPVSDGSINNRGYLKADISSWTTDSSSGYRYVGHGQEYFHPEVFAEKYDKLGDFVAKTWLVIMDANTGEIICLTPDSVVQYPVWESK